MPSTALLYQTGQPRSQDTGEAVHHGRHHIVRVRNIYASKASISARIHPAADRHARPRRCARLAEAIRRPSALPSRPAAALCAISFIAMASRAICTRHQVYDRASQPCPQCSRTIPRDADGSKRSTTVRAAKHR